MVQSQHTAGPWLVNSFAIEAKNQTVCIMGEINAFESGYEECRNAGANGRLIAAAPDLLAVLIRIEGCMDFGGSEHAIFDGLQDQMLAAIAKATGKPASGQEVQS